MPPDSRERIEPTLKTVTPWEILRAVIFPDLASRQTVALEQPSTLRASGRRAPASSGRFENCASADVLREGCMVVYLFGIHLRQIENIERR